MTETQENPELITSDLANEPDMLDIVEMFVDELPDRVASLQKALAESDIQTLTSISHQLKGAAGGYGFGIITDAAAELEQAAKNNADPRTLEQKISEIADLCNRATALPSPQNND